MGVRSPADPLTCGLLALSKRSEPKGCSPDHLFKRNVKMAFMFENLDVYRKAVDFIDQITSLTDQFPRGYYFLVNQLNRAALSIATNIAEGNGRFTKADRKNFFIIARGSVQECIPLLELGRRKEFIPEQTISDLRNQLEIIAKMLSGLIKGLENRRT